MDQTRLGRLLRLLALLQSRLGYSAQQLADQLGVSKRTVFRDLKALSSAGVPLESDPSRGGYILAWWARHHPAVPSSDLLVYLLLTAKTSPLIEGARLNEVVDQSISEVLSSLRGDAREETIRLLKACVVDPALCPSREREAGVLPIVLEAIRKQCRLRIRYWAENGHSRESCTAVAPYRLVGTATGWWLLGRSSVDRGVCCYDLRQIVDAELTDDSFELPCHYARHVPAEELVRRCRSLLHQSVGEKRRGHAPPNPHRKNKAPQYH